MAEITTYKYRVEPQDVDFTLRASASAIINYMLNVAGSDAHNKGFGVEVLQDSSLTWVLMRFAVEIESRPEQYADIEIDTWISDFNRLASTPGCRHGYDEGGARQIYRSGALAHRRARTPTPRGGRSNSISPRSI